MSERERERVRHLLDIGQVRTFHSSKEVYQEVAWIVSEKWTGVASIL